MPSCCKVKNILSTVLQQFHELPKNFSEMKWDVVKLNRSVHTENKITVPKGETG